RLSGLSEVARNLCVVAVPIFGSSVLSFQESEEATIGAVFEFMAPRFDRIARFDGVARNTNPFEPGATSGFQSPYLRLALCIFNFEVDPGMRDNEVHFFDNTFEIYKRVGDVVAMRMMRPRRKADSNRKNHPKTKP